MNNLEKLAIELKKNNIDYYTTETQLIINTGFEVIIEQQYNRDDVFQVIINVEGFESMMLYEIEEIRFGYMSKCPILYFYNAFSKMARMWLK